MDSITQSIQNFGVKIEDIINSISQGLQYIIDLPMNIYNSFAEDIESFDIQLKLVADNIYKIVDPSHDDFFLKKAFIPSDDFINQYNNDMINALNEKLPIIIQIKSFFDDLSNSPVGEVPQFKIQLPSSLYGGGEYDIIDLSFYMEYRDFVHMFIILSTWFFTLKKIYRRIPKIIY